MTRMTRIVADPFQLYQRRSASSASSAFYWEVLLHKQKYADPVYTIEIRSRSVVRVERWLMRGDHCLDVRLCFPRFDCPLDLGQFRYGTADLRRLGGGVRAQSRG